MSYNKWPKRSAEKNYFMVPNEIFSIGLDYREISLYAYLLRCENRETYQCYPSYKTIGKAIGMSENTVAKYVRQLEEKGLIYTEPTIMQSKDGKPLNGNLLYTIRPIPGVLEAFYERQFQQMEEDIARQRVEEQLAKASAQGRQNALCASFREEASPSPNQGVEAGLEPFSADFCRTKEKAGRKKKQDERKSRINAGVAGGASGRSQLPAVRAVTGVCGVSKVGSKTAGGDHACGHRPRPPTVTTKK